MSGLEVVGQVLESLPLVISSLEHYADCITRTKRYWRYKSELRPLILQITTERAIFINTIEQLFHGIIRIEHMTEFLANSGGTQRLKGAYAVYFANVSGMANSLARIRVKLALDPDGKPQFSDPNLFEQEYKRLKFSLSQSDYTEQLSELKNHNQALTRLTKQSLEMGSSRNERKHRYCPGFDALQKHASSLYNALNADLCCTCGEHTAELRLESRGDSREIEANLEEKTSFRLVLMHGFIAANVSQFGAEVDVQFLTETGPLPLSTDLQNARSTASLDRRSLRSTKETSSAPDQTSSKLEHSRDFCLFDRQSQSKHTVHVVEPLEDQGAIQEWSSYTLTQILTRRAMLGQRFYQLDRFKIAVILASTVLQLSNTPWLDDDWCLDEIHFVHRHGTPLATVFQYPFLHHDFPCKAVSPSRTTRSPFRRVIRNQMLYTLGIVLIELLYGKPIEELQTAHDLDCQGTPGAVWCTAERLNDEEIALEAGQLYSDAVRRCIRCDFNQENTSLDDEDFQRAVFDGVVGPLEKTLMRFNGQD
ncbi:hypothetical protein EK21DRAFT_101286 [Setomelanomma holmii]|uniref:DUF7580 domain-containing protein n=1 Tax=Setomelanomma holmii TaxID=210430 RepID=A0A9P4H7R4_9PLEO|nr:hypothetical protein EK21DRAFT_101286 [Setomelanomma holmii]